jgi:hypothetical protein
MVDSGGIKKKLLALQQGLRAPKGQYNEFGGFNYRSCEDILEALKPLLAENKCIILLGDELVEIGGQVYIKARAALEDTESNAAVDVVAYAREPGEKKGMDTCQITGATSSYARKYALNGLLAIDDARDSDTRESDEDIPSEDITQADDVVAGGGEGEYAAPAEGASRPPAPTGRPDPKGFASLEDEQWEKLKVGWGQLAAAEGKDEANKLLYAASLYEGKGGYKTFLALQEAIAKKKKKRSGAPAVTRGRLFYITRDFCEKANELRIKEEDIPF